LATLRIAHTSYVGTTACIHGTGLCHLADGFIKLDSGNNFIKICDNGLLTKYHAADGTHTLRLRTVLYQRTVLHHRC